MRCFNFACVPCTSAIALSAYGQVGPSCNLVNAIRSQSLIRNIYPKRIHVTKYFIREYSVSVYLIICSKPVSNLGRIKFWLFFTSMHRASGLPIPSQCVFFQVKFQQLRSSLPSFYPFSIFPLYRPPGLSPNITSCKNFETMPDPYRTFFVTLAQR